MPSTKVAESAEVTKNIITRITAIKDRIEPSGICANIAKSAAEESWAATADKPRLCVNSMCRAVPPKILNQIKFERVGAKSMPSMNCLMVLPLEMRAKNIPTKGDQAIHQAQ